MIPFGIASSPARNTSSMYAEQYRANVMTKEGTFGMLMPIVGMPK